MKEIVFIIKSPPYGTHRGDDGLTAAMLLAALEQKIRIAFIGDGVWHLTKAQNPQALPLKAYTQALKSLNVYDIAPPFVLEEDLQHYNLSAEDFFISTETIKTKDLSLLMENKDASMVF